MEVSFVVPAATPHFRHRERPRYQQGRTSAAPLVPPPPPKLEARPEPPFGAEVPARPHFRSGKRPRYHFRKWPRGTSNAALPTSRAAKVPARPHFRTRKRLGAAFAPNRKKRMISGPGTSRTPLTSLTAAITHFRPRKCGFGT